MAHPAQSASVAVARALGGLLVLGLLLLLAGWGVGADPMKDGGKVKDKRDEEKEDDKGPTKKKPPPDDPEKSSPADRARRREIWPPRCERRGTPRCAASTRDWSCRVMSSRCAAARCR